jgi:hypothetical protein
MSKGLKRKNRKRNVFPRVYSCVQYTMRIVPPNAPVLAIVRKKEDFGKPLPFYKRGKK